jgi:hypothetical protein
VIGISQPLWLHAQQEPGEAWTVGQLIYWDSANARCTIISTGGNTKIGVALAAAANPSSTGSIRLNGVFLGALPCRNQAAAKGRLTSAWRTPHSAAEDRRDQPPDLNS